MLLVIIFLVYMINQIELHCTLYGVAVHGEQGFKIRSL